MAEAGGTFEPESSLQMAVSCSICFESMTDSRTLIPCMHTFCCNCVTQINQEVEDNIPGILCPLCMTFIAHDNIKPNPLMSSVIEMIVRQESGEKQDRNQPECVQCGSINIVAICLHCDESICQKCRNRHRQMKGYQNHEIVNLEDAQRLKRKQNVVVFCSKHPSRQIERNCIPCNHVVCPECLYDDHNEHKSESIEQALNRITPQVRAAVSEISAMIKHRKSLIKSLKGKNDSLNNNKLHIIDQATKHKTSIIKQFVDQMNKALNDLVSNFDAIVGPKSKELDLRINDIESSVASDESLVTWILTILDQTDGGGLLNELQSGLIKRIDQIQQQSPQEDVEPNATRLYEFRPAHHTYSQQFLGEIKIQRATPPTVEDHHTIQEPNINSRETGTRPKTAIKNIHPKQVTDGKNIKTDSFKQDYTHTAVIVDTDDDFSNTSTFDRRFIKLDRDVGQCITPSSRENTINTSRGDDEYITFLDQRSRIDGNQDIWHRNSKTNLKDLGSKQLEKVKTVRLGMLSMRLCIHGGLVLLQCRNNNSITVLSLNGSIQRKISLDTVSGPYSLHPLHQDKLLLAADSGLYVLDCHVNFEHKLFTDRFEDVHIEKHTVAGVTPQQVYVFEKKEDVWNIEHKFPVTSSKQIKTILIRSPHIFVCGFDNNTVHKYKIGEGILAQFTGRNFLLDIFRLDGPRLCMSDETTLMVCGKNKKLTVLLSDKGSKVANIQIQSGCLWDTVIHRSTMYVLCANDDGCEILIYKIK